MQKKIYFSGCLLAVSLLVFSSCASSRPSPSRPTNDDGCAFRPYQKPPAKPVKYAHPAPGTPIGSSYKR